MMNDAWTELASTHSKTRDAAGDFERLRLWKAFLIPLWDPMSVWDLEEDVRVCCHDLWSAWAS